MSKTLTILGLLAAVIASALAIYATLSIPSTQPDPAVACRNGTGPCY